MQYMDALTKYFDNVADNQPGKPSTIVWTFTRTDAFMRIPEPQTLWLGVVGGALLNSASRRKRTIRPAPDKAAA